MINSKTEIYLLLYIVKKMECIYLYYRKRNYFSLGDNLLEACLSYLRTFHYDYCECRF